MERKSEVETRIGPLVDSWDGKSLRPGGPPLPLVDIEFLGVPDEITTEGIAFCLSPGEARDIAARLTEAANEAERPRT